MKSIPSIIPGISLPLVVEVSGAAFNVCEYCFYGRKVEKLTKQLNDTSLKNKQPAIDESKALLKDLERRAVVHEKSSTQSFFTVHNIVSMAAPLVLLVGLSGTGVSLLPVLTTTAVSVTGNGIGYLSHKVREAGLAHIEQRYIAQLNSKIEEQECRVQIKPPKPGVVRRCIRKVLFKLHISV